ncbi:unnamed protein product [Gordionus sp. m RMFG-2023]
MQQNIINKNCLFYDGNSVRYDWASDNNYQSLQQSLLCAISKQHQLQSILADSSIVSTISNQFQINKNNLSRCINKENGYVLLDGTCYNENQIMPDAYFESSKSFNLPQSKTTFKSFPLRERLKAADSECRYKNNITACNMIANYCVLSHYAELNYWCKVFRDLVDAKLPLLLSRISNSTRPLDDMNDVPIILYNSYMANNLNALFDGKEKMALKDAKIKLKAYDLNGHCLGLFDLSAILMCPLPDTYIRASILSLNRYSHIKCYIDSGRLWNIPYPGIIFFDPYISMKDSPGTLIPIPLYIFSDSKRDVESESIPSSFFPVYTSSKNIMREFMASDDMKGMLSERSFYRRFFVAENVASPGLFDVSNTVDQVFPTFTHPVNSTHPSSGNVVDLLFNRPQNPQLAIKSMPSFVQYAKRVDVLINSKGIPNIIMLIQYERLDSKTYFNPTPNIAGSGRHVETILNIDHVGRPHSRMLGRTNLIILAVVGWICFAHSCLRVWLWVRQADARKQTLDLDLLIKFFFHFCGPFALLIFATVSTLSLIVSIRYKIHKENMNYPLPTRFQERPFVLCIIVALSFLAIHLLYHLSRQTNYELFFIDWENINFMNPNTYPNDKKEEEELSSAHHGKSRRKHKKNKHAEREEETTFNHEIYPPPERMYAGQNELFNAPTGSVPFWPPYFMSPHFNNAPGQPNYPNYPLPNNGFIDPSSNFSPFPYPYNLYNPSPQNNMNIASHRDYQNTDSTKDHNKYSRKNRNNNNNYFVDNPGYENSEPEIGVSPQADDNVNNNNSNDHKADDTTRSRRSKGHDHRDKKSKRKHVSSNSPTSLPKHHHDTKDGKIKTEFEMVANKNFDPKMNNGIGYEKYSNNINTGSASRIMRCIEYWCKIQTFRNIPNRKVLFTGLLIIQLIEYNKFARCYTGNDPPGIDVYTDGNATLTCLPVSGLLRFAILSVVFVVLAFLTCVCRQFFLFLFNRLKLLNKSQSRLGIFPKLITLCQTNNVSLLVLKEKNYAVYLHCVNGFGTGNLTLEEFIFRQRYSKQLADSGMGANNFSPYSPSDQDSKALGGGPETQPPSLMNGKCYEISLNPSTSNLLNQSILAIQQPLINQFLTIAKPGTTNDMLDKRIMAYQYTNSLLIDFLSKNFFHYMPYQIVYKTIIEKVLNIEMNLPLHMSYLYPHTFLSPIKRLLLVDNEVYLLVFEILVIASIDYVTRGNFMVLAVFVACFIDWIICEFLHLACKRSICAKTLIDFDLV